MRSLYIRNLVQLFLISLIINTGHSTEKLFRIERLITDFNGIVSNGDNIICYGNYGIFTFSSDLGKSWGQQNIGDKYNIKRIKTSGSDFIGITENAFVKSIDNGLNWTVRDVFDTPFLEDMTLLNNTIYILTKNSILLSDIDLNISQNPVLMLEPNSKYSELETDGINLYFIRDNKFLLKYNIKSQTIDTLDFIKFFNCKLCNSISGLKVYDGIVYIQLNQPSANGLNSSYFLKSSDNGESWEKITGAINNSSCYKIIDNQIIFMKPIIKSDSSYNSFLVNGYFNIDSSDVIQINSNDNISRHIRYDKSIQYKEFITINENIIVAVGTNKLISISYDFGKSFEFISLFNGFYDNYNNFTFLNDNLMIINNLYDFYKTTDGGITWLPQLYSHYNNNIIYAHPDYYYFDDNGLGFAKYKSINTNNDSSAFITYDFGERFIKSNKSDFNIESFNSITNQGIDLGSNFIFLINPFKDSEGFYNYTLIRYDKTLNFIDSTQFRTGNIINISKIDTNTLIALTLISNGSNKADSNGNTIDYSYNYSLIKSSDSGYTWELIKDNLPISQKLVHSSGNFFYLDIMFNNSLIFNNLILFPTIDNIIYTFDFFNNKFDSIPCPAHLNKYFPLTIFKFNQKLFVASNLQNNVLYFADIKSYFNSQWDSLSLKNIFAQWDSFNYFDDMKDKDAILLANLTNDTSGILLIGKSYLKANIWEFRYNIIKLSPDLTISHIENDFIIEQERAYLWNSNPYPVPGKSMIQSNIYWNKAFSNSDLRFIIHDINGSQLINPKITFDLKTNYSGLFHWDCSEVLSGIYIIQVILESESISFPVIVSK